MSETAVLKRYRQRIEQETEGVPLVGITPTPDRKAGRFPVNTLYAQVQALWFAPTTAADDELSGKRWTLDSALIDLLRTVRCYGAELYRRGQTYRALERPDPASPDDVIQHYQSLVFLGIAGSGKTTLQRYFAHQAAVTPGSMVPILCNAYDYESHVRQGGQANLYDFTLNQTAGGDSELLQALQSAESLLWLIDDLQHASFCRPTFLRQLASLPGQIVTTSSWTNYQHTGLEHFAPFELLPMTDECMEHLLYDWLVWRSRILGKGMDWVRDRMQWMQTEFSRRPAMSHVLRNPFALTCVLQLFADGSPYPGTFPESRTDLYNLWLNMSVKPDMSHFPDQEISEEAFPLYCYQVFAQLAEILHRSPVHTRSIVIERLDNAVSHAGDVTATDRQLNDVLLTEWLANGLLELRPVGGECYLAFRHSTIREYAIARRWAHLLIYDQQCAWSHIAPYLHHEHWREPILMMGRILDSSSLNTLVRQILKQDGPYEHVIHQNFRVVISLIGECGDTIDPSLARHIIQRIARFGKSQKSMRVIALSAIYLVGVFGLMGIGLLGGFASSWLPLLAMGFLWTLLWGAVVRSYEFPGFQNVAFFPLRLWRSLPERSLFARLLGHAAHASAVPFLVKALHDRQADIRRFVTEALGHIADIEAVPALLPLLHDENGTVRRTAALALGEIGAIPRLVQALNDSDSSVRNAVEEALERLSRSQAIPHLALMLQDPKEFVRKSAVQTLRRIGGYQALSPLVQALKDEDKDVRLVAAEALGELAEQEDIHSRLQAKDGLLNALQDSERSVRWAAAYALGQLNDPTLVPELIQALKTCADYVKRGITDALKQVVKVPSLLYLLQILKDDDAEIRFIAVEALQGICQHETCHFREQLLPEIAKLVNDPDMQVRRCAVETLADIGGSETVELLVPLLNDLHWQVRWAAAEALGKIGHQQAVPHVMPLLKDSHGYVCRAATAALGKIGGDEAVPLLIQGLRSEKRYVQKAADDALHSIGAAHTVPFLLQSLKHEHDYIRQEAEAALRQVGQSQAVPYLIQALSDSDDGVRRAAAIVLGGIGENEAVPALIPLLQDKQETIRSTVAEALGEIGNIEAISALIATLDDSSNKVRRMAAKALGRLRAQEATEPLLEMLHDDNMNVRRVTVEALGRIASEASIPAMLEALQDDAWWLRWSAAYALGRIGDHQVIPQLLQALHDENGNVRQAAAEALGQLGAVDAMPQLIEALSDEEWWVRWAAATALRQLNDSQAFSALIPLLRDTSQNVRWAATEAIGKLGSSAAAPHLIQALRDGSWEVCEAAAKALQHISEPAIIPELLRAIKSGHTYVYKVVSTALENIEHTDAIPFLVEGMQEDHELVREAAAEHLIRLGGTHTLRHLFNTLKHDHWRVRHITAIVIEHIITNIDDVGLLRRTARALWWRLTDKDDVAIAAFQALDMVVARMSALCNT